MSNMILNVEFLAGSDLKDALKEAKEKAIALNVALICFDFNGKSFAIGKNSACILTDCIGRMRNERFKR